MKEYFSSHAHFQGSLLDGMSRIEEYAQRAKELGQNYITSTDHGNLLSLMENMKGAQKLGINYLPGIEAYRSRGTRFDDGPEEKSGPATTELAARGPYHQTIVAYNNVGYHNLLKLSSKAYTEGYLSGKARVDLELIDRYSEGLCVLSGCLSGEVQDYILQGRFDDALQAAATMQEIVGKGNYFIEIMNHHIPEEIQVQNDLVKIAKAIGAPIVATNDSHYTLKEDAVAHDHLLCVNTNSRVQNPDRFKFSGPHFYLKSYEEMAELFPSEWIDNSMLIAEKYDINLDLTKSHYPEFKVPQNEKISVSDYFVKKIGEGATNRYGSNWKTERRDVADRLNEEIETIRSMGYESYFMIVQDIIAWCAKEGILTGWGRGSSASSCVAYCLGITHVDPIRYGLLFERFLTPGRVPDIDIDIDDRYRDKALAYIRDTYGEDYTAQIGTMSKMKAKSVIKDVARVTGHPFEFGQGLCELMPPAEFGVTKTIDECLDTNAFKERYDKDEDARKVIDISLKLEDLWRQTGTHAGGIIVSDEPIVNHCPVMQKGPDEPILIQWDMRVAEDIGLLKIDLLGLGNLGIINDTIDRIRKHKDPNFPHAYEIGETDDPKVYEHLAQGHTALVFQMSSDGVTDLSKRIKIDSMEDIMAVLALYRPGPMASGFHYSFPRRKLGRESSEPLHPLLNDILEHTYGILLYQEQILLIAKDIVGFDPVQSNKFLKSIGKKDRKIMAATKESFVKGCLETSGITEAEADILFGAIEPHADYSFVQAHAASYAYISYVTAYLSYYYPAEYAAANLTAFMFEAEDKFRPVLNDVREKLNIEVTSPSVNKSNFDFTVDGDKVIYSISGLRGVGHAKSQPFVNARENGGHNYTSIYDLLRKTDIDIFNKVFTNALITSGAMDDLVSEDKVKDDPYNMRIAMDSCIDEMKVIGLSLTENLFELYKQSIGGTIEAKPVSSITTAARSKKYYGVIKSADFKVSKAGKKYANMQIEDDQTFVDAICFSDSIAKIKDKLGEGYEEALSIGTFIVFEAVVREEDESFTVFISDVDLIHNPNSVEDLLTSTTINLESYVNFGIIDDIMKENPGENKVYFNKKHPHNNLYIRELHPNRCSEEALRKIEELI